VYGSRLRRLRFICRSVRARILYWVAVLLALLSGLLFGVVPVRQILRTDPYQIIKSGSAGRTGRRFSARDLLLVLQVAICAVLLTSSMVRARPWWRSIYGHLGFRAAEHNDGIGQSDDGGYREDSVLEMQKRMIQAMETIPGVEAAKPGDKLSALSGSGRTAHACLPEESSDLRLSSAALAAVSLRRRS